MADPAVFRQVRQNMEVRASDGSTIGSVANVIFGEDTTGERHSMGQFGMREVEDTTDTAPVPAGSVPDAVVEVRCDDTGDTVFVPHQAVAAVSEQCITLHVDNYALQSSDWAVPPYWATATAGSR